MVELNLMETLNSGLPKMYRVQKERFFPLPGFDFAQSPASVSVRIHGKTIDLNYSRMLMKNTGLSQEHALWLDRVQKKFSVSAQQLAELRQSKLIKGRKPNFYVSASIAKTTGAENEYVFNKGFNDDECKDWIIKRLKVSPATGEALKKVIWGKLPAVLSEKEIGAKVKNLRTALRLRGHKGIKIEIDPNGSARGPKAVWKIR